MKKKNLKLNELNVKSFVINLNDNTSKILLGGTEITEFTSCYPSFNHDCPEKSIGPDDEVCKNGDSDIIKCYLSKLDQCH